jgi:hypothetical protein
MANANCTAEGLSLETRLERAKLAFGASTAEHAMIERGDARGVVAAVFETLERIDQLAGNRLAS